MGAKYAFPQLPELLGQIMFWGGAIGLVITAGWIVVARWPLTTGHAGHLIPFLGRRQLGLTDGARLIYKRASPQLREEILRSSKGDDPNPIETWGKHVLQVCAAARIITLKGRRGPGLPHETIPSHLIEELRLGDDDSLSDPHGGPQFIEVIVSRSDALRVLREYEAEMAPLGA